MMRSFQFSCLQAIACGPAHKRLSDAAVLLEEVLPEAQVVPTEALLCYWDSVQRAADLLNVLK
ncbi:hypothetical protein TRIATDRAFT_258612 [Trichoderma atroviride IMI 206040]|uniref:Uncharacterized protein n=1 Tax=Hypocrea atroviridis (strain ATCC 20476 / IMI 206040) TaxID=452589 RepID=G9P2B1_HYPAI|nr:uncharacterized protein TRIATDRAFT_258612 [Trichoderma atroviride IMI 206040]EHK43483.1 hypothetical protein TRIATDRAFT_258612 [Trichoderma atroviride IMI 206040]